MRILITGAVGRLGALLAQSCSARGHEVIATSRNNPDLLHLDITDFAETKKIIADAKPDVVLHPAAWTDVDGCAREPDKALLINGLGTQNVALAAAAVSAAIVYVSTNEVFDGKATTGYTEYDRTHPINPYGYSKWYGERAIRSLNPKHYIVRTAWLFAHGGKNFIQTMLNAAQAGRQLRVVTDEVANPTYSNDLAQAISTLIETERYGIYHLVNEGTCSRYGFARYVLDRAGYGDTRIERISAREWPRPSTPPRYTPLRNLAGTSAGVTLRAWQAAVDDFLQHEGLLFHGK